MTIDDTIRDEKLKYDTNIKAEKNISVIFWKIDNYEYLLGEEILRSDQRRVIEQPKFTYDQPKFTYLGKALEKQTKTIENQGTKQLNANKNQNKRLVALTNKGYHKDNNKEMFENLVKEKFNERKG